MPRERFLEHPANLASFRIQQRFALWEFIEQAGPLVAVSFPVAGAKVQVAHGLKATPDARFLVMQTGAVYDVAIETWTGDLAFLTAPVAFTYARLIFFRMRQPYTGG